MNPCTLVLVLIRAYHPQAANYGLHVILQPFLPHQLRGTAAPPVVKRQPATERRTVVRRLPETAVTERRALPLQGTGRQTRAATARTGGELRPRDARTGATGLTKTMSCYARPASLCWGGVGDVIRPDKVNVANAAFFCFGR